MKVLRIRRVVIVSTLVLALIGLAAPVFAQTGQFKGKVVDSQNKPVADAKITMLAVETNRKFETKTNNNGEWRQIGLPPETRKFTPHVTLARLRGTSPGDLARYIADAGRFAALEFPIRRFVLFSSRDSVGGGPYLVEQAYPLAA